MIKIDPMNLRAMLQEYPTHWLARQVKLSPHTVRYFVEPSKTPKGRTPYSTATHEKLSDWLVQQHQKLTAGIEGAPMEAARGKNITEATSTLITSMWETAKLISADARQHNTDRAVLSKLHKLEQAYCKASLLDAIEEEDKSKIFNKLLDELAEIRS